jgi:hypothetical protein
LALCTKPRRVSGRRETWLLWGNLKEDQLEDVTVEGMTILKCIFKGIGCEGVYWINLAQDMDTWRALVMAAVNLRVP